MKGRTPQGVRGLKFDEDVEKTLLLTSHPARGAWIEIGTKKIAGVDFARRTPQGVRGLKWLSGGVADAESLRRTPQGVRGLK